MGSGFTLVEMWHQAGLVARVVIIILGIMSIASLTVRIFSAASWSGGLTVTATSGPVRFTTAPGIFSMAAAWSRAMVGVG